ncbi:MAG TPA: hypothetical protein P5137_12225, partial [Candidatus Brocadiia bacterium]|nr:hypothetical protein [Candidatus Brocadiia bacterium]
MLRPVDPSNLSGKPPPHPPRFLLDSDGGNLFGRLDPAAWRQDVEEAVRECPPNVTTYVVCSGGGWSWFPSAIGNPPPPGHPLKAVHESGQDPLSLLLNGLKQNGKEVLLSVRMNDVHNPTDESRIPAPRRRNPDCIVGVDEVRQGQAQWMSYCLDYSRPEVQEYALSLIREQVTLYGQTVDGLILDWMRFPRHLSGSPQEVWQKRAVLTGFTASVRRQLAKAGRPILLAARVPPSLDGCRRAGLDIAEWTRQGLVDFLVASPFLTTDFSMPIEEMRAALGQHAVPIYAAFDMSHGDHQMHCPESLRAAASGL